MRRVWESRLEASVGSMSYIMNNCFVLILPVMCVLLVKLVADGHFLQIKIYLSSMLYRR